MTTRRDFIKKTVAGTAALSLGSILPGFGSSRYQDILGANEKIRIGVIGVNSRGKALAQGFAKLPDCEVTYIRKMSGCYPQNYRTYSQRRKRHS